jgi:outer membrane protein TolC
LRFAGQLNMLKLLQRQLRVARKRTSLFSKGVSQGGVSVFQMLATQQLILKTELAYLVQLRRVHESYLALGRATGMGPVYAGAGMHVMKKGGAR